MDLNYFKEHIHEELTGAKEYIDSAIEAKINHPAWSRQFVVMADAEADHAGNLMRMLETYIRSGNKVIPTAGSNTHETDSATTTSNHSSNAESVYKDLMKEFGETMTYVTNMKRGL